MKKIFKIILMVLPIALALCAIGGFYIVKVLQVKKEKDPQAPNQSYKATNMIVFPQIKNTYLYKYIRMEDFADFKAKPYIDQEMVAELVKEVMIGINTSVGKIKVSYEKITPQKLIVDFLWTYQLKSRAKQYVLKIITI